jgi:hypothetical protein
MQGTYPNQSKLKFPRVTLWVPYCVIPSACSNKAYLLLAIVDRATAAGIDVSISVAQ